MKAESLHSKRLQVKSSTRLTCVAGVLHQPAAIFDGGGAAAQSRSDGRPVVPVFLLQPEQTKPLSCFQTRRPADGRRLTLSASRSPRGCTCGGAATLTTDEHSRAPLYCPPPLLTCQRGSCCRTSAELVCRRRRAACSGLKPPSGRSPSSPLWTSRR